MLATSYISVINVNDGQDGSPGAQGPQGVSITGTKEQWFLSTSNQRTEGTARTITVDGKSIKVGQWTYEEPALIPDGYYLWGRIETTMSEGNPQYSDAVHRSVISGIKSMVDEDHDVIESKVWETYTQNQISSYDNSTVSTIRNSVSQMTQNLTGITSRVETVESKYATKAEVGSNNLYVIANQVPGYLHQSNGSISAQNATGKEFTSAYIPVKEGESIIIQSWCTPLTEAGVENPGYSWLAYQFFSDDDPVTPVGNRVAKWGYSSGSGVETMADGKEHLVYTVTAPANTNYIRMSYRSYEDGYAMVEKATTPSEYAINPKDLESYTDRQVSSVRTIAEQVADKFTWLVESGDSSSNFTLTDRAAQLVAQYINLNGTVTFSAFDADTQNALTSGAELIVGTQASSTSAWTGKSTKLKSLASGTRISYKLPYASTSTAVTLNLTLNNNTTTGAKNVYYLNDTRLTTQYGANSIVELIYDGSAWRVINPYSDQNTYDRTRYQQPIKAGSVAIAAGNIIVAGANNVGTYTHLKRGQAFDTTYPILYAGSAISANSTGTDNYLIVPMGISTTQSGSYTAYKAVYIKGTLSGTTFTPISTTPLTQTIPTSADNYHYILLGTMYSTTEMYLLGEHPIFAYYNGGFKTVAQIAAEAATSASSAVTTAGQANDNASAALTAVNSSIKSTTMHYLATSASSGVTTSTSGWDTSPQSITATNRYLWTYQTITKVDNTTYDTDPVISGVWGNTGSQGSQGDQGVSVTKVEQLYRTSSSTTAPTAPSSVITSTSTSYNTWTLAMPTYNTSYPYYYTCTQTTYSNGNHTWTTVARSKAIEDANTTANTASANASDAVSVANTANGNASAAVTTANNANNTATTALNGIKAFTGTCTTAAGTSAKVVTSDNSFTMTNGVTITITFSTASTADSPTLNVNSLGPKAIYFDKAVASSTNRFRWKAGSVITFQYNGTNWVVLDYKNIEYTSSSTANNEPIKTNSSTDGTFVLCRGTTINVYFSEANTANAPKLNIDGTGEIPIYYKGAEVNSSNKYLWAAGSTFTFTYNGASRWYMTDGGSKIVKDYAQTAVDWVDTNGSSVITAKDIISNWATDATSATTTIEGGLIRSHTITSDNLATDAIISNGYTADTSSVYSTVGTFLDLANGNIKSPTFAVDNINGMAYIDGTISARNLLVGTAAAELSASVGTLNSSQGALVGNALDAASDYLIYDGESIYIKTSNFGIDPAGNVTMTGEVNAASGSIGGWTISPKNLHYGSSVGSEGSVYLIPEGSMSYHTVGGSPEMSGWVITAGDSFGVTNNGSLYANDANITGTFTITDGGIGGMTIDSDSVYGTTAGMSSNQAKWAFWAGETNDKHGASDTNAVFKVGGNGKLYATNADITGKITAQSGTIGGWKITSDSLYYYTNDTVPQVGTANSVFLCPEGSSTSKSIGGSPSTTTGWVFTAGTGFGVTRTGAVYASSGRIGGVTLSDCNVYAYNTTTTPSFQLLSTGYLAIGGTSGQITVDTNGVLSIPAARITGQLTAGQIETGALTVTQLAGFDVDDDTITDNSITMSTANFTKTINGTSYTNLRFAIGSYFGVSNTGALYSCSGKIGGFNIGTYHLYSVATSNGTIGSDGSIYLGSTNLPSAEVAGVSKSTWRFTVGSYFGVTGSGQLYCTRGQIGGLTILGDRLYNGSIGGDGSIFVGASNLGSGTVASQTNSNWRLTVGEHFGVTGSTVYAHSMQITNPTSTRDGYYAFTVQNSYNDSADTTVKIGAAYEGGMTIYVHNGNKISFLANNGSVSGSTVTGYDCGIVHWKTNGTTFWPFRYNYYSQTVFVNGTQYTSSDERIKTIYKDLGDEHKKLFMELKPVEYSFIDKPDERHFGFGAQTTQNSMEKLGFDSKYSVVTHSSYNYKDQYGMHESYYLNYIEALMLSIPVVQDHEKEIAKLKTRIEELEDKLSQLTQ